MSGSARPRSGPARAARGPRAESASAKRAFVPPASATSASPEPPWVPVFALMTRPCVRYA
jgi:hypothetical protein